MFFRMIVLLSCLLISADIFGQTLTSTVDRNQLSANQTLRLTISYDGNTRTDALDLQAVQQDFDVVSTSTGNSYQLSNNQSTRVTTWDLVLIPKRTGKLAIPSFSLGNIVSDAIEIEVVESGQVADDSDPMIVALSLDREQARVGEQVLVTIKLRARTHLADLAGEEFKVDTADVLLVNQKDYGEVQDGINWRVIEWTYALFPQNLGTIAIPKQMFTATIPSTQRRSFFDSFATRGQRIARRSDAIAINVLPAVTSDNDWFPASNVSVSASWTSDPENLRVGEPMTRTIEVRAESQLAAAIPPLSPLDLANYKAYQDQPALENLKSSDGLVGVRRESSAIVPAQEGLIEFPQQVVRWWDINSYSWREAILPAETHQVLPAAQGQSFSPPENFEAAPVFNLDSSEPSLTTPTTTTNSNQTLWMWAAIALALVVSFQTVLLLRSRINPAPASSIQRVGGTSESEKKAWSELEVALKSNNAASIRSGLLGWSRNRWTNESVHTLDSIAARSQSNEFKKALLELDQILFKGASAKPSVNILHSELKRLRNIKTDSADKSELAPLYPQPF